MTYLVFSIPVRTSYDFETTLIKSIPYTQMSRGFEYEQFFLPNIIIDEIMYIINASNSPEEFLISFSEEKLDLSIRNKFDIDELSLFKHTADTLKILENIGLENNKDYKIVKYDDADSIEYATNQLNHIKVLKKKHAKAVAVEANFNKARNTTNHRRWIF